jgi:hypothetical protein
MKHALTICVVAALLGCNGSKATSSDAGSSDAGSTTTASATTSGSAALSASAKPPPPAYKGPTGTLTGTITMTGDEAPLENHDYPDECAGAAGTYGKLFRTGLEGQLADAIITVTKYKGYVPAKREVIDITIKKCQYSTRAVAMTAGQHIDVRNLDLMTSYVPWLDGARMPAAVVAVPRGEPVTLYTRGPGRYWLRDQMGRKFMVAHVFHFRYATTDVTRLDGKYRIEGIPVGKVEVSALLPAVKMKHLSQPFEIKEGDNTLDLEMAFDAEKDLGAQAPAGSASAKAAVPKTGAAPKTGAPPKTAAPPKK